MAIFVAKPSRGTLAFFGLVVAGLAAVRGYARHEVRVERRDGPASEEALRFALCFTGGHAGWIFRDPEGGDTQARWAFALTEWLKITVTAPGVVTGTVGDRANAWPQRCIEPLQGLSQRLHRVGGASSTAAQVNRLTTVLRSASESPQHLVAAIDDGSLGALVAQVLVETYTLSTGTRSRWVLPSPVGAEVPTGAPAPRWRPVGADVHRVVPVAADAVLSRGFVDGVTRRLRFANGRVSEEAVGAVVPWDEEGPGGWARASTETAPVVVTLGSSARVLPWPGGYTLEGLANSARWHGAAASARFALLVEDAGSLYTWATPGDTGDAGTTPAWSAPLRVGPSESHLAAVLGPDITPSVAEPTGWRVTALRPTLNDALVVQYRLRLDGATLVSETVPVRRVPEDAPAIALRGTRFVSCTADTTRYLAAVGIEAVTVLRVRGDDVVEVATRPLSWPRHRTMRLACDATRALLSPDGAEVLSRPWGWQLFQFGESVPNAAALPMPESLNALTETHAVALTAEGVVAAVTTPEALRVMRLGVDGATWSPGALLTTLRPAPNQRRTIERVTLHAAGDNVLAMVRGATQTAIPLTATEREMVPRPPVRYGSSEAFVLVAWSADGGQRFVSF